MKEFYLVENLVVGNLTKANPEDSSISPDTPVIVEKQIVRETMFEKNDISVGKGIELFTGELIYFDTFEPQNRFQERRLNEAYFINNIEPLCMHLTSQEISDGIVYEERVREIYKKICNEQVKKFVK